MRHLLSAADLDHAQTTAILDLAEEMAQVQARPVKKLPALRGRTVVNLFFEDSTRTRSSFELAEIGKSTRLNSSHANISYAVFCLKKKNISLIITKSSTRRHA